MVRYHTSDGDLDRISPFGSLRSGTGGAFGRSLEDELAAGHIDVAVHSLKDLATDTLPGLVLLPPPEREDVRDAMCGARLRDLPAGARVGTGASRRRAQLLALRPDLDVVPIRGNVPPRLAKIGTSGIHAVVLAVAGLNRIDRSSAITEALDPQQFVPSPGQGALGIQVRADDDRMRGLLNGIGDDVVHAEVRAERALLAGLHGDCSAPVGALARLGEDGALHLNAQVTAPDGSQALRESAAGDADDPEGLGAHLAAVLIAHGAASVMSGTTAPNV